MFKKVIYSSLLAASLAIPSLTLAANDGTLGATSTGDLTISVTLQDLVQISRMNDITFGTYTGTGDLNGSDAFCVYRNGTGAYQATLTGDSDGAGGAGTLFFLTSGANNLPYTVTYDDGSGASAITSGTPLTGQSGDATAADCGAADNTTVNVTILEADLQSAATGAYTGVLTILVAPE